MNAGVRTNAALSRAASGRVALVACCGQKLPHAAAARDLYRSDLFRKSRAWAEANADGWLVLSTLHGVVPPEQVLAPYDVTLAHLPAGQRRQWAQRVRSQLNPDVRYVVLAGERYCGWIDGSFDVWRPLRGMGIGQQLAWLKRELDGLN